MRGYLRYIIQNCITALDELCAVNEQLQTEMSPDSDGDVNRTGALNRMIQDYLIIRVAGLFDRDDRTISFYTEFPNNPTVNEMAGRDIIGKIKETRHRFVAHADREFINSGNFSIPTHEICASDLREILDALNNLVQENSA